MTTTDAQQLTDDADWEAIAAWCGGKLINHRDPSDEYFTELRIDTGGGWYWSAYLDDWVIRTADGFKTMPAGGYDSR